MNYHTSSLLYSWLDASMKEYVRPSRLIINHLSVNLSTPRPSFPVDNLHEASTPSKRQLDHYHLPAQQPPPPLHDRITLPEYETPRAHLSSSSSLSIMASLPFRDINVHASASHYAFTSPSSPSLPTLVIDRPSGDLRLNDGALLGGKRVSSIAGILGMVKLRLGKQANTQNRQVLELTCWQTSISLSLPRHSPWAD